MQTTQVSFINKGSYRNQKCLNQEFANACDWFGDNKLSIHFGVDKIIIFF